MSRYNIPPHTDPTLEVTVGWDSPLSTFFANVIRPAPDEAPLEVDDEIILCVGNRPNEYISPAYIADAIKNYADLSDEVSFKMLQDSVQAYQLSPIQQWVRNLLQEDAKYYGL